MELPPRGRAPPDSSLDSASLTSLDSSVFCSEGEGEPLALGDSFTVNVGGSRFVLSQQALSCFPHTRLGKLAVVVASCRRRGALAAVPSPLELCDDANPVDNEYFFDRSSQAFRYVLHYYRTGRLHVMEQLCALSFLQEIQYWGIDELSIDSCCRDRYPRGAGGGGAGRWVPGRGSGRRGDGAAGDKIGDHPSLARAGPKNTTCGSFRSQKKAGWQWGPESIKDKF